MKRIIICVLLIMVAAAAVVSWIMFRKDDVNFRDSRLGEMPDEITYIFRDRGDLTRCGRRQERPLLLWLCFRKAPGMEI